MKHLLPIVLAGALLGTLATAPPLPAQATASTVSNWSYFGSDRGFKRYAPHTQIDASNIGQLSILWRRPGVDPSLLEQFPGLVVPPNLMATPTLVDGVLYAPNAVGLVEAFDPATGETLWTQQPFEPTLEEAAGSSTRGVDVWKDGSIGVVLAVRGEYLYALDQTTGAPMEGFGEGGRILLRPEGARRYHWTSGPIVVGDVVVVAGNNDGAGDGGMIKEATPEDVRGFDVRTGELLWTFGVVPREGEFGAETWENDAWMYSGDLGSWCCLSADENRGIVYVPLSAPTSSVYGGHRPGDNLFSNTLVALDAATGRRVWHFQMVHHDLWEYDNMGPPILGEITVDGRRVEAVMQPNKNGFLFVLDRGTGEPVWPIEERPVPQSTVPGEFTSPTQPFPTKPPPFDQQGFTLDDVIDFTPELRERALELLDGYVLGPLYTPPSEYRADEGGSRGTVTIPGGWGSANWNTGAFDPETGVYYAVSHTRPGVRGVVPATDPEATMDYVSRSDPLPRIDDLPITKPPYGRVTAIDLTRGEHLWVAPIGNGPRDHPLLRDLDLPPLGMAARPAPLVTGSLLFLGEGSDAMIGVREGEWGRMFRAFDKSSGEIVWETELPAGTTSAPMSYVHEGKQYIVVAIGGTDTPPEWIAFGLP